MSYIDRVLEHLRREIPDDAECPDDLLRLYALLVLQEHRRGTGWVTLEDVHNAWALWRQQTQPSHKYLKSFPLLHPDAQTLDVPWLEVIRRAASRMR